ncbi:MAG: DsrE family protein [Methanoregula sp.]|uniref:DsrE family protein n=1 Tax=Methanoregula sp. TaxID=2052170 RepID=UPI003BB0BF61
MTAHVLFLSTVLTQERLSWVEETIKCYYQEMLAKPSGNTAPLPADFAIFLTGDALYSLSEAESQNTWLSILALPQLTLICDGDARGIRGISLTLLKERFPDKVRDCIRDSPDDSASFWKVMITHAIEGSAGAHTGWLQISSPYMFPSAEYGIQCLFAALDLDCGITLCAYLDGCHIGHTGQNPGSTENIGAAIEKLGKRAAEKSLPCTLLVDRDSAGARGYVSWDDGLGTFGSLCMIKPAHIRNSDVLVRHIGTIPVLLSENAGSTQFSSPGQTDDSPQINSVVILITHSPYTTGHAYGGIALAAACAHQGIPTRVVFLEEGVLALTGDHRVPAGSEMYTLPELISYLASTKNLQISALTTSFHMRGISKHGTFAHIQDINFSNMSRIVFGCPDASGKCSHQHILFF